MAPTTLAKPRKARSTTTGTSCRSRRARASSAGPISRASRSSVATSSRPPPIRMAARAGAGAGAGQQGREGRGGARAQHSGRLEPAAPGDRRAPGEVIQLVAVVGVGTDHEAASERPGPADAAIVEVEALVGAVYLEERAGLRGRGVEGVPVEVEVLAAADLAARGGAEDVPVRVAHGPEGAGHAAGAGG